MPCLRHNSATGTPASCSFRIPMICSSVYRDRFIRPSPSGPDSISSWLTSRGARHALIGAGRHERTALGTITAKAIATARWIPRLGPLSLRIPKLRQGSVSRVWSARCDGCSRRTQLLGFRSCGLSAHLGHWLLRVTGTASRGSGDPVDRFWGPLPAAANQARFTRPATDEAGQSERGRMPYGQRERLLLV